jgi:Tfp pilus assembly protein PilW
MRLRRLWCVCEVYFAHEFGHVPRRAKVAGSDAHASAAGGCLEAKCFSDSDRIRILHALLGGSAPDVNMVERVNQTIRDFRKFSSDAVVAGAGAATPTLSRKGSLASMGATINNVDPPVKNANARYPGEILLSP